MATQSLSYFERSVLVLTLFCLCNCALSSAEVDKIHIDPRQVCSSKCGHSVNIDNVTCPVGYITYEEGYIIYDDSSSL